jgi:hypothetical protein
MALITKGFIPCDHIVEYIIIQVYCFTLSVVTSIVLSPRINAIEKESEIGFFCLWVFTRQKFAAILNLRLHIGLFLSKPGKPP